MRLQTLESEKYKKDETISRRCFLRKRLMYKDGLRNKPYSYSIAGMIFQTRPNPAFLAAADSKNRKKDMKMKKVISTDKAPAAIGPYSQAVEVNGMVYTSGVIPVVPETGEIPQDSKEQAKQALANLSHLLEAAGSSMEQVIKTTVFIKNMDDFGVINEVYQTFFQSDYPARSCIEAARLPKDVLIEIEAVAAK